MSCYDRHAGESDLTLVYEWNLTYYELQMTMKYFSRKEQSDTVKRDKTVKKDSIEYKIYKKIDRQT